MDMWRIVVDLEWSRKRAHGNKKGRVLVRELMLGRHDDEIKGAEDKEANLDPCHLR